MALTWNDLFVTGALINFTSHVWRAQIRLTAKDLGLDNVPEVQQALSLGSHRLAPWERMRVFTNLENSARREVDKFSLNPGILNGVRYVPDAQIPALLAKLTEIQKEFDGEVETLLAEYESIRDQMLPITREALVKASKTPEAAERAYQRVLQEYPSRETVRTKFGLEWKFFTISAPVSDEALNAAKDAGTDVSGAVRQMMEQLRTELNTKVGTLIELAKRGEALPTKSVNSALELLNRVDGMNVLGDKVLEQQVRALRAILEQDEGEEDPDVAKVMKGLQEVQGELEQGIERAVASAEKQLTGLGRRKLQR